MFVAKFAQVQADSTKFNSDKNGNMPFIGEVLAGKATATLVNGTMFVRNGLLPNKLYACENVVEDYTDESGTTTKQTRVQIIAEVSVVEYPQLRTVLGAGVLDRTTTETTVEEPVISAEA